MKDIKQKKQPTKIDLKDSPADEERLKKEETTIDMPDVKDIPGQEFVHIPKMGEFTDATISSADEEGDEVWAADEQLTDPESDVTPLEKQMLQSSAEDMPTTDELQLRKAVLDDRDDDGELLNEKTSASAISGSDLDIPGADDDDKFEQIGEEDEENNSYSLGGDEKSENEERSGT